MTTKLRSQIEKLRAVDGRELMRLGIYDAVTSVCAELDRRLAVTRYEGEYTIETFTPEFVAHLDIGEGGQLCLPLWQLGWMCGVRAWETHTGDVVTSERAGYDVRPGRPYRQSWESALADTKASFVTRTKVLDILGLGNPVVL